MGRDDADDQQHGTHRYEAEPAGRLAHSSPPVEHANVWLAHRGRPISTTMTMQMLPIRMNVNRARRQPRISWAEVAESEAQP